MFHRRRKGPFPSRGRTPAARQEQGQRRAHTQHTHCTRGGTQMFAAKLERKYPPRELQPSTLSTALSSWAGPSIHPPLSFSCIFFFLPELKKLLRSLCRAACVGHSSWGGTSCSGLQAVQEKWPHKCIFPKQRPLRDLGLFSSHRPVGEAHQDLTGDAQWV